MSVMKVKHILLLCVMGFFSLTTYGQIYSSSNSRITTTKEKKKRNFVNDTASYNRVYAGFMKNFLATSWTQGGTVCNGAELGYLRGVSLTKKCPLFLELGTRISFDTYRVGESYEGISFIPYNIDHDGSNLDYNAIWKQVSSLHSFLLAVSIPVSLTYKRTFANGFYLAPYVGPQLRLNILGMEKVKIHLDAPYGEFSFDDELKYSLLNDEETNPAMKRAQLGFQFGLNLGYKVMNFGLGYDMDLSTKFKGRQKHSTIFGLSFSVGLNF